MSSAFAPINSALGSVFDLLLRPLAPLPPLASLALVSLVTAVIMLLVVRRTSNQRALDQVKRQIHAALFEIRLFNDDLSAIFRAQGDMLRHNLTYLRLSLAPMVWMFVPFVLVIAQLQFQYGYDGLEIGHPVLVTAHVRGGRIRSALGLREQLFVIDREYDDEGRVTEFVFTGRGWGHGVGMCQVGALGYARMGKSYKEILQHYYSGVQIERAW